MRRASPGLSLLERCSLLLVFLAYVAAALALSKALEPGAEGVVAAMSPAARVDTPAAAFERNCAVCHAGSASIGPSLSGVVGRRAGSVSGYQYSAGMRALGIVWTEANLRQFLKAPAQFVPGTAMGVGPLSEQDLKNILDHLEKL